MLLGSVEKSGLISSRAKLDLITAYIRMLPVIEGTFESEVATVCGGVSNA